MEFKVVYSGSFKCYKVFSLKMEKESAKRWDPPMSDMVQHELRVKSCELWVENLKVRV